MTRRVLKTWLTALLAAMALFSLAVSAPAGAHKEHKKKPVAAQQVQPVQQASPGRTSSEAMQHQPTAAHGQMGEMMEDMEEDRSNMSFVDRLIDWLGRTHPVVVHFPIAFFPAALFTAVVGRRRPAFATPVQFLVVAGGIIAPIAALLGWFDAMNAEPDAMMTVHRWLGTAIGTGAVGIGVWAARKPEQVRSTGMIAALTLLTGAIVVQGWYGGAMVHGMDHMNW